MQIRYWSEDIIDCWFGSLPESDPDSQGAAVFYFDAQPLIAIMVYSNKRLEPYLMETKNTTLSALSAIAFCAWAKGKGYDPVFRLIGDPERPDVIHSVNELEEGDVEVVPCYDVNASNRDYAVVFDQDCLVVYDDTGAESHRFPATAIVTHIAYKAGTDECVLSTSSESFCLIDNELIGDTSEPLEPKDHACSNSVKRRGHLKIIK